METLTKAKLLCYPSLYAQVDLSREDQEDLLTWTDEEGLKHLAGNPGLDCATAEILAGSKNAQIRQALAEHVRYDAIHETLLADTRTVRSRLAQNPHTSVETRDRLREDVSLHGRIARNPGLTPGEIEDLYQVETLQNPLAENPSVPWDVQRKLHETGTYLTHLALARNTNVSEEIQSSLREVEDIIVLEALSGNPGITRVTIERLVERADTEDLADVAEALGTNPSLPEDLQSTVLTIGGYSAGLGLSANPNVTKGIQETLLGQSTYVSNLAKNPNLAPEYQGKILEGNPYRTDETLATNPNLSREMCWKLAESRSATSEKLATNSSICPWSGAPARFVQDYQPHAFDLLTKHLAREELDGIGRSWTGTVEELCEAIDLTRR